MLFVFKVKIFLLHFSGLSWELLLMFLQLFIFFLVFPSGWQILCIPRDWCCYLFDLVSLSSLWIVLSLIAHVYVYVYVGDWISCFVCFLIHRLWFIVLQAKSILLSHSEICQEKTSTTLKLKLSLNLRVFIVVCFTSIIIYLIPIFHSKFRRLNGLSA